MIDLRSDTVTLPTRKMREAMYHAEVGDDVYGDDPTVKKLEEYASAVVGKEAALFVPSGTFGNQLALLTHCRRGDEVILGDDCHIVQYEVGASSVIAGVQLRTLSSDRGKLDPDQLEARIRKDDLHSPRTGLICLENAHSNGKVIPIANMQDIYERARNHKVPVHLDGARIFNAAAYLGVDAADLAQCCDSVMFSLSKGLCAPVGSMLAGNREFIGQARKGRKLMGGGLRQAGFLAAAGLVALREMRFRLAEDRDTALFLGTELLKIPGVSVALEDIHINMVFADLAETQLAPNTLVEQLSQRGIRINPPSGGVLRFVTHHGVTRENVEHVAQAVREAIQGQ